MFRFPWKRKLKEEPPHDRRSGDERRHLGFLGIIARGILAVIFWFGRLVRRILAWLGALVVIGVALYVFAEDIVLYVDKEYPEFFDRKLGTDKEKIALLRDTMYYPEQSEIVAENSTPLACISSPERRVKIDDPADIPPLFRDAVIASEDKRFFSHRGVDKEAIVRAGSLQLAGLSKSGASTLTMQLAKDLRGGEGRKTTMKEKIGDAVMALRIEQEFTSKEQILLKYANTVYFGRGQYGVEAASQAYFGKQAKDLVPYQMVFLVSLINKPALPDRALASDKKIKNSDAIRDANWQEVLRGTRRVLSLMYEERLITSTVYASAAEAIDAGKLSGDVLKKWNGCGAKTHYLEFVRQDVAKRGFRVDKGGLTIPVPQDQGLQNALQYAVNLTLKTYLARHPDDLDNDDLRAGAFAVDFTGKVLAEVGNVDFAKYEYDVMATGWRQPGSTFKPIVYTSLVEGLVKEILADESPPETVEGVAGEALRRCAILDAPIYVSMGRGRPPKKIENFHSRSEPQYRGLISCEVALGESRNTAAMRAGARAGIDNVIDLAYRSGMPKDDKHPLQPYPTTAIGASEVNPLSMASTIAFVNGGFKVVPRFANDVCKDGKSLLRKDGDGVPKDCDMRGEEHVVMERVLHPAVSLAMMDMLKSPLDLPTGTAHSLRTGVIPGRDPLGPWVPPDEIKKRGLAFPVETSGEIAGKTGTATNADGKTSDVWLLLYVPGPSDHPEKGIMLGFWMGKDSKTHHLGERGSTGGPGFAESGGRNWVHSAATVLAFLQKERGLLKPENKFQTIYRDDVLLNFGFKKNTIPTETPRDPEEGTVIDPSDPNTDPAKLPPSEIPRPSEKFEPYKGNGEPDPHD